MHIFFFSYSHAIYSSSTWSNSEPSSLQSNTRLNADSGPYSTTSSTTNSNVVVGNLAPDDEEQYEAFGVGDDADSPRGSESPSNNSPIAGNNSNR